MTFPISYDITYNWIVLHSSFISIYIKVWSFSLNNGVVISCMIPCCAWSWPNSASYSSSWSLHNTLIFLLNWLLTWLYKKNYVSSSLLLCKYIYQFSCYHQQKLLILIGISCSKQVSNLINYYALNQEVSCYFLLIEKMISI